MDLETITNETMVNESVEVITSQLDLIFYKLYKLKIH